MVVEDKEARRCLVFRGLVTTCLIAPETQLETTTEPRAKTWHLEFKWIIAPFFLNM